MTEGLMGGHEFSRRDYLRLLALADGVPWARTGEVVDAQAQPGEDLTERRPLACWLVELPPSDHVRADDPR